MVDEKKKKAPAKLVMVLFNQAWRGHEAGTVVELTAERAAELIEAGTCEPTADLKASELKAKIATAEKAAAEAREAAKAGKTAAPKSDDSDFKALQKQIADLQKELAGVAELKNEIVALKKDLDDARKADSKKADDKK